MIDSKVRILLVDIETAPNLGWIWGKWEQNVIENKIDWYMMCFSYKWLDGKVHNYALPDFKSFNKDKENDKELVQKLHEIVSQANIVIAHNGDAFDVKKYNARFIIHGLTPPPPYKTIDTKKVAKKYFKFDSNKLTDLGKYLGLGEKIDTGGFELWKGCMVGNKDSWRKMIQYNNQDIILLEKIYYALRPWINNHPYIKNTVFECSNCGEDNLQSRGWRVTKSKRIRRLQCQSCGAWQDGESEKRVVNKVKK